MRHLTEEQIAAFRGRSLNAGELAQVSEHLSLCPVCREHILPPAAVHEEVEQVRRTLHEIGNHFSYEELAGYVDGTLPAAAIDRMDLHVADCESCARELRELTAAAQTPVPAGTPHGRGWRWNWVYAGAAIGAMALLAVVILMRGDHTGQVAKMQPLTAAPQVKPVERAASIRDAGGKVLVRDGSVSGIEMLPESYRASVKEAIQTGKVNLAIGSDIRGAGGSLLGDASRRAALTLLSPVATVVESQKPEFRWTAVQGATYRVIVGNDRFQQMASSGWLRDNQWAPPNTLPRGGWYSWQITMRQNGKEVNVPEPPQPEAKFRVLTSARETELEALRHDWGNSHLVMGIVYADDGLLEQAGEELKLLRQENPQSDLASSLAASLSTPRVR